MTTTAATRWLTDLAAASRTSGDGWSETVRTALHDFTMTFGRAVGRELPAAIHRGLATTPPMPTVCEHRDFAPWNLLVHGDKTLSVLDWESSVTCGVPALDLIYFLTYLAFAKQKITAPAASALPAYRAAWSESTAVGRVNHACVRTYMSALGLDPAALPSLRLLTWLVHTRSEYRHLRADCGGGVPSDRSLRDSLFFTLMKEDLRERPAFALEP
jgi:aminoglycoside phosphotransferase (APT) family kinase protein